MVLPLDLFWAVNVLMNFDGGYIPLEPLKKLDGIATGEESDRKVMRVGQYFGRVERRCSGPLTGQFDLRRRR